MSDLLLITEKALAGLGILNLFDKSTSPAEYILQLDLDTYQSNSQRDWLALRWQEKTMFESVLHTTGNNTLRITKAFTAENREQAIKYMQAWAEDLNSALERVKQSRV